MYTVLFDWGTSEPLQWRIVQKATLHTQWCSVADRLKSQSRTTAILFQVAKIGKKKEKRKKETNTD